MVIVLVVYESPGSNDRNQTFISEIYSESVNPREILKAIEQEGLSWEIEDEDTKIYIVVPDSAFTGREFLKLAHMKVSKNYKFIDESIVEGSVAEERTKLEASTCQKGED